MKKVKYFKVNKPIKYDYHTEEELEVNSDYNPLIQNKKHEENATTKHKENNMIQNLKNTISDVILILYMIILQLQYERNIKKVFHNTKTQLEQTLFHTHQKQHGKKKNKKK